jgi:hypothetical protein
MSDIFDIAVSDDFEPAPGVDYEDKVEQPSEPVKEEKAPEQPEVQDEPEKPATPKAEVTPEPVKERPKKAGPIADLLEKKHTLETELEAERLARQELEAKILQLSRQPQTVQTDDKIKAFAEANGIDESIVNGLVQLAREGISPELPREVHDFIEERAIEKQKQAELQAFDSRVQKLKGVFKDEPLDDPKVKDRLQELAYSTELAPDGEPYYQKELSELYFAYIKPEVEPGTVSAEPSQGGTQASKVLDFEEIARRDDPKDFEEMDDETFKKFNHWLSQQNGRTPLRRK